MPPFVRICPACGGLNPAARSSCRTCGADIGSETPTDADALPEEVRAAGTPRPRSGASPTTARTLAPARAARDTPGEVVLTTAPTLEGYRVVDTLDVITAECVFGMELFREWLAGFTDDFGARSQSTRTVFRDARNTCLRELRNEAALLGANAVIAVDLSYSELGGHEMKNMLFLVASGTAVVVEPL